MEDFNKDRASEPGHPEFDHITGNSLPVELALAEVERVAPSDSTLLVLRETGTGNELLAGAIHHLSVRCGRLFVKLNCAAIPFEPLESELL